MERIFDQTVGQLAGVKVITTGKSRPKNDGTDAYAQAVFMAGAAGTATTTSVASSGTSVTLLAANAGRLGGSITNDSTAILYVLLSSTPADAASTSHYTLQMAANTSGTSYFEIPSGYTGAIYGIWASANGFAKVTEYA